MSRVRGSAFVFMALILPSQFALGHGQRTPAPSTGVTVLHSFDGTNGAYPSGYLVEGAPGRIFGTTGFGGDGILYEMSAGKQFSVLHAFSGGNDGALPGGITRTKAGELYGAATYGGADNFGALFRANARGGFKTFYTMDGSIGTGPASLIEGNDGNFYGVTNLGYGTLFGASVFRITNKGDATLLHSFGSFNLEYPGPLMQASDGNFYGLIFGAVFNPGDSGVVYKMTPEGQVTILHQFTGGADGAGPNGALVEGSDGALYGTTLGGGSGQGGVAFRITTSGDFSLLYSFQSGAEGFSPRAGLAAGNDGCLYGTTYEGGPGGFGTLFQLSLSGKLTTLYGFTNGADGGWPAGAVMQARDGSFYGTTSLGGTFGYGVLFRYVAPSGQ